MSKATEANFCEQPCELVEKVSKVMFGNGKPEQSLMVRIHEIETKIATIDRNGRYTFRMVCGLVGGIVLLLGSAGSETIGMLVQLLKGAM